MSMLNRTMIPINPASPFNPPLSQKPLIYKAVWISNPPNFTIIEGAALAHPEQWKKPTHALLSEMVGMAVETVFSWHEKEPVLTVCCSQEDADSLGAILPKAAIVPCLPAIENGVSTILVSAKHFHTKTICIHFDRLAGHKT